VNAILKLAASAAAAAAIALLAPSSVRSAPAEYFTGLYGTVVVWPWKDPCPTRPCDPPTLGGITLTFSHDGVEVARVTTGSQGGYAVVLGPGSYTVSAPPKGGAGKGIVRRPVTVIAGRLVQRTLGYDAGIR
jgi:hypothetical protein